MERWKRIKKNERLRERRKRIQGRKYIEMRWKRRTKEVLHDLESVWKEENETKTKKEEMKGKENAIPESTRAGYKNEKKYKKK